MKCRLTICRCRADAETFGQAAVGRGGSGSPRAPPISGPAPLVELGPPAGRGHSYGDNMRTQPKQAQTRIDSLSVT